MRTKIIIFLIINISFVLFSCDEDTVVRHSVPYVRVNFSVDVLNYPELQTPFNAKYIDSFSGKQLGYKGHGIYLISISSSEYRAFDASCTYATNNDLHPEIKTHLELEENQKMIVKCPKCGSKFNLIDGSVQSGLARFPMKEYKTRFSGKILRVFN